MLQSSPVFCEVEPDGIAHVFTRFAVGAVCACGRSVAALSDDEKAVVLRHAVTSRLHVRVVALPPAETIAGISDVGAHRLLAAGASAIERARALRQTASEDRAACRATRLRWHAARADHCRRRHALSRPELPWPSFER